MDNENEVMVVPKTLKNWVFLKNFFNYLVKPLFNVTLVVFNFIYLALNISRVIFNSKTIKNEVSFSGVALHRGLNVDLCIKPAEPILVFFKRQI